MLLEKDYYNLIIESIKVATFAARKIKVGPIMYNSILSLFYLQNISTIIFVEIIVLK